MENNQEMISNTVYPWVTFKVKDENYCITSEYVVQILMNEKITPLPESPPYYFGITFVYGESYPIIDMRTLFDQEPVTKDIEQFARIRDMHLDWVVRLKECVANDERFELARDPRKCSFGVWFDSYTGTNATISNILKQIDRPHNEMHKQAEIIDMCKSKNDTEGIKQALNKAEILCEKHILPLLDDLIEAFIHLNRGIVVLVRKDDKKLGLLVDEITSIESFNGCNMDTSILENNSNKYLCNVITTPEQKLYIELCTKELFDIITTL